MRTQPWNVLVMAAAVLAVAGSLSACRSSSGIAHSTHTETSASAAAISAPATPTQSAAMSSSAQAAPAAGTWQSAKVTITEVSGAQKRLLPGTLNVVGSDYITLDDTQQVKFDKIKTIAANGKDPDKSDTSVFTVTLTNGETVKGTIGSYTTLSGETSIGRYQVLAKDVQQLDIQR